MIQCLENTDVHPRCPHCKKDLPTVWYRSLKSTLGQRYIYFCTDCRAVLGISHRKGFWMG